MNQFDIITGPITALANRYGVSVLHNEMPPLHVRRGVRLSGGPVEEEEHGWSCGPQGEWLNIAHRIVAYYDASSPEGVLHELAHVILGERSLDCCESYVLFPFEWAMVRHVHKIVGRRDRHAADAFRINAALYQDETMVLDGGLSASTRRPLTRLNDMHRFSTAAGAHK